MKKNTVYPNLIIAGVVKGGTTSIFSYLSQHPDVFVSSTKETGFFKDFNFSLDCMILDQELDVYAKNFDGCDNQKCIVEATAAYYLGGKLVAKKIHQCMGGDGKVLVILREPVSRLVSFYKFKKNMLELDRELSLEDYINKCESLSAEQLSEESNNVYRGICGGEYFSYLGDWIEIFGDRIKVVFFDSLVENSEQLMQEIACWLGIDEKFYRSRVLSVENKTVAFKNKSLQKIALSINSRGEKYWRSNVKLKSFLRRMYYLLNSSSKAEKLDAGVLEKLSEHYRPHNLKLRELLSKRGYIEFPDWLVDI